jgi:hypothetical protein
MSQISKKLRDWDGDGQKGLLFFCPGCNKAHSIRTDEGGWNWNGDIENTTFMPSVKVTYPAYPKASEKFKEWHTERICHSFVKDGMIQFLGDCTHTLVGQTVQLADFPEHYG